MYCIVALLALASLPPPAAARQQATYKLAEEHKPEDPYAGWFFRNKKQLVFEIYDKDGEGDGPEHKILISALSNRARKAVLFTYDRAAIPFSSADEKWIVINDRPARGDCIPRLFRRNGSVHFAEVKNADIHTKVRDYFLRRTRLSRSARKSVIEGQFYVEAEQWSEDSKSLLIRISKETTGEPLYIRDWYCIYEIPTGTVTEDLSIFNRGAYWDLKR